MFPFVFPYRVKNPPERIPYVTLTLIFINILVFAATSELFLRLKDEYLTTLAVSYQQCTILRLFTAMFLHADILHLAGNMWFLWLFGPSVEGRLKPLKFIVLYLLSGLIGGLLHLLLIGVIQPEQWSLGASGAIMGLSGAYLYVFPYAHIKIFWLFWICVIPRGGIAEWHARWVALYYIGIDIINGMVNSAISGHPVSDGVAHFAHIGGFATGLLTVALLQVRKDTMDISEAQAMRADVREYEYLSFYELEALMQNPTDDMRLVLSYCEKALLSPGSYGEHKCFTAMHYYIKPLLEYYDQHRVAALLLRISIQYTYQLTSITLLRVGSNLEHLNNYDMAVRIYRRVFEVFPNSQESQIALMRLARIMEKYYNDRGQAHYYYSELIRAYPSSQFAEEARRSLKSLPYPFQQ